MTGRPRAVLWDLDGTIADSKDFHWRAWRETMAADGVQITYEQFLASFGQRNDAILGSWLPDAPNERIVRLGDEKEAAFRRLVAPDAPRPDAFLVEKHFGRKHGAGAYYGQKKKGTR